jgi:3-methyl-2-oxobutanoate hydroxymethyltransferase
MPETRKPITLHKLQDMHQSGEKIAMLTCYDAAFATLLDEAGVDILLVGDSLGTVLQAESTTTPVKLDAMTYHTRCTARGNRTAWLIGDLPFGSYHASPEQAWHSSLALMQAGAHMVKLECGDWAVETVRFLTQRGIPVCAHLGFTPQTVSSLGGYKVQGRGDAAERVKAQARAFVEAGAQMLLFEMIPAQLAAEITQESPVPVIGIGAGKACSGQVLVLHDLLDVTPGRKPKFVKNFMAGSGSVREAVARYVAEVKSGAFPDDAVHGFQ